MPLIGIVGECECNSAVATSCARGVGFCRRSMTACKPAFVLRPVLQIGIYETDPCTKAEGVIAAGKEAFQVRATLTLLYPALKRGD